MGLQRAGKYHTEGGARYLLRVIGHSNGEGGTLHENTEKELPGKKKFEVRTRHFSNQYTVSPVGHVEERGY